MTLPTLSLLYYDIVVSISMIIGLWWFIRGVRGAEDFTWPISRLPRREGMGDSPVLGLTEARGETWWNFGIISTNIWRETSATLCRVFPSNSSFFFSSENNNSLYLSPKHTNNTEKNRLHNRIHATAECYALTAASSLNIYNSTTYNIIHNLRDWP